MSDRSEEVKAEKEGFYFVTLFQFKKEKPSHPSRFKDWVEFDGDNWVYAGYEDSCYVCDIHKRDES